MHNNILPFRIYLNKCPWHLFNFWIFRVGADSRWAITLRLVACKIFTIFRRKFPITLVNPSTCPSTKQQRKKEQYILTNFIQVFTIFLEWGCTLISGWALVNFFSLQDGHVLEVGTCSRLVTYSNKCTVTTFNIIMYLHHHDLHLLVLRFFDQSMSLQDLTSLSFSSLS